MKYVSDIIASFEKKLVMVLMFAMAIVVALGVFFRYVLNNPLFWAGEVSIFLLIYITFLGGSLGLKYKMQASVTIFTDYLPGNWKKIIDVVGHLFMLVFMAIILFYCFKWISSPNVAFQKSSALLLPMWIPYSIIPIGFSFATIHITNNLLNIFWGGETK
ncbi:TRAP transporter small permease [Bacillus sp. CGMCC 1.16607]|uniref:TRAP transporter small permease n=1 Tax=Bacillus sp. CGMCC 1.16607 TaxID=3351842 RepID=UPI0036262312